jgi:DNA-directed RNA polymerase specialized sigma24 family protein
MAALALPEESLSTRASENARLALLLREYRASGKNAKEAEALTQALHPKMLNIAANLALCYGLPLESSDEAVQELFTKWLKQGGILVGWSESGGASVTTWIYRALQNTLRNLRDKEHNHQKWLQADIDEETEKRETDLIHRQPDVRAKSQSFLVYLDQRSKRLCQFADEMVGNTVQITDANGQTKMTQLTEHHRATFMKLLELAEHGDLTDHALGKALRESKATAGRWKLAVFTYIQTHPQREEIKEWIKPVWISVLKES